MMINQKLTALFLVAVLLSAGGCWQNRQESSVTSTSAEDLVARVGTHSIREIDIESYLDSLPRPTRDRLVGDQGKRELVQTLVERELLVAEAHSRGLQKEPDLARKIDDLLIQALLEREANRRFSDEVAENLYEQHQNQFVSKRYPLRHLLFRPKIEDGGEAEELAKRRAIEALELIKAGAAFSEIASEKSEDSLSAKKGGDLGNVSLESLPPGLANVVRDMQIGLNPQIVRSSVGYHVVELTGPPVEKRRELEEVRPLLETLNRQKVRSELIGELKNKYMIELY